jgi:formiminoglutamase
MDAMSTMTDERWPSAASLLVGDPHTGLCNIPLLGAHTYATSVSARSPIPTATAIRGALNYYATYSIADDIDLLDHVRLLDRGDIHEPDGRGAIALSQALSRASNEPWILLGGDNALTWHALRALAGHDLAEWGLITFDAHLDLREGRSNGSPVRQLLAEGLPGAHVVQIGLADFSNSAHYASVAREAGVTLMTRDAIRHRDIASVVAEALEVAGAGGRPVYGDIDVDVCDRSAVPGCPAAAPGGLSADELRRAVRTVAADSRVRALDVTEIDVTRDAADGRTVRLGALLVLEAALGIAKRAR